ncbi:MAG: ATP-binding cassette domain-containing protein [Frankiaceae bacterium]|nr:ATP-binding cassette domain-containing protein [Frankiaceae bacterium]
MTVTYSQHHECASLFEGTTPLTHHELAVVTDRLTKRFGDFTAVDEISFSVATGSVVALLGPNGAGKTTTVRMIATLLAPTSGTATVCGHDVEKDGDAVRSLMSLTGQFAALEDNLTARENLVLMTRLRGYDKRDAAKITDDLIDRFDIGEFRDQLVKSVSGGQRRRVDLAASLVVQPKLLVLDEPTTGLDPRSRQVVWSTVRDLVAQGVTLLLTTQYLEEADELAEQIVLIDHGKAVATGTPADLKAQIGDHRVDITTVDVAGLDALAAALRVQDFDMTVTRERRVLSIPAPRQALDLSAVADAVAATGIPVDEVALRRPTLDDAFLALTGHPAESATDVDTELDSVREEARV